MTPDFSIVIPANNEENYIASCLEHILEQTSQAGILEVIVVCNACSDETFAVAGSFKSAYERKGWRLEVVNEDEGGKPNALNVGDRIATGRNHAYLDADILCGPNLFASLREALQVTEARYATGNLKLRSPKSVVTRAYGRFWMQTPFMKSGAVGAGMYAVNKSGRDRWQKFPKIISDDSYARLHFSPNERFQVAERYHWPLVEGFSALVKVRRRQDMGVIELKSMYPNLVKNEAKSKFSAGELIRLLLTMPIAFATYVVVSLAVRCSTKSSEWVRGR